MSLLERDLEVTSRTTPQTSALLVRLAVASVLAFAVGLRLHSPSALWLDEALSVDIARLPLSDIGGALKQDGAPPLYYLLLHVWMAVFGQSTTAVRELSAVFSVASLPVAYVLGTRVKGEATGLAAVLLLASSPFAVRYATETRMYSLVVLLTLLGGLALLAAWADPSLQRLFLVTVVASLLLLTHYWSLYLLAVTGAGLLWLSFRGGRTWVARRCALALIASLVPFLPWLPVFLYQAKHTGTPWAPAPSPGAITSTLTSWFGGTTTFGAVALLVGACGLVVLGLYGRVTPGGVLLTRPVEPRAALLVGLSAGTMIIGVVAGQLTSAGFVPRYASVALAPFLFAVACGVSVLLPRARAVVLVLAVLAGGYGCWLTANTTNRTQAGRIGTLLTPRLRAGDLVVYCPDQAGPAVSRLLPTGTPQVVYPTMAGPELVDWVDYAQRNAHASPTAFAAQLLAGHTGRLWVVASSGHLTFGQQCVQLANALTAARGTPEVLMAENDKYAEQDSLTLWRSR